MEVTTNQNKQKVVLPFLIAGALCILSVILYGLYLKDYLDLAIKYDLIRWGDMTIAILDILITLLLGVFAFMIAFKESNMKLLVVPSLLGAGLALYKVVTVFMSNGLAIITISFLIRNALSALAFIFLMIYIFQKGISIVYSAIFAAYSAMVAIWYNGEELLALINQGAALNTMYSYILIILMEIGLVTLIWTLCIRFSKKLDNKDIIKKDIALAAVVSIVTLGIYAVIWVKSISDDIAKLEGIESHSSSETVLFFTVPFYCLFWYFAKGKKLAVLADDADMSWLYSLQAFFLLGLFSLGLMQGQLHRAIGLHK